MRFGLISVIYVLVIAAMIGLVVWVIKRINNGRRAKAAAAADLSCAQFDADPAAKQCIYCGKNQE